MVPFSALDDLHAMDISDHHRSHQYARDVDIEELSHHQGYTPSRSSRLGPRHHLDGRRYYASSSASSSTYRDIPPPPQYVHAEQQQHSQQPAIEGNNGNKTWAQIWADIEKGTSASPVRQQSRGVTWRTHTDTDGLQAGHSGASNTTQNRGLFNSLRRALPVSLLGGAAAATAAATTAANATHLVSSLTQQQAQAIPSSLASLQASDKTLSEYKESMSSNLYKSTPIRLLALTILLFNTLLVIKVMADPMTPFNSGRYGMNGDGVGQITLGNSPAAGLSLEERFPCVAATSHNDEMQAAPFVSRHHSVLYPTSKRSQTF